MKAGILTMAAIVPAFAAGFGCGLLFGEPSPTAEIDQPDVATEDASAGGITTLPNVSVYEVNGKPGLNLPDWSTVEHTVDVNGVARVRYDFSMGSFKHHGTVNSAGHRHGMWYTEMPDRSRHVSYWFMGRLVSQGELDRLMAEQPNGGW